MANQTWQEHLQDETYTVGNTLRPGEDRSGKYLGWGEHYEVHFANGSIALVDKRHDSVQAVRVPGKRGYRLHVNGQSHWRKWGRFNKGAGIAWTGRKGWNTLDCPWRLWQYCKAA